MKIIDLFVSVLYCLRTLTLVSIFQEAYVDANRDESFIIELLELKNDIADNVSARWFMEDLAQEQAVENSLVNPKHFKMFSVFYLWE